MFTFRKNISLIVSYILFVVFLSVPLKGNSRLEQIKTMEQEIQSLRKTLVDLESRLTSSDSKGTELANKLQTAINERRAVVLASRARSAMIEIDPSAKEEYKRGYMLLANGKIEEAQRAFEYFAKNNVGDSYVVNARYWLGEIKYYNGDYEGANVEFIYVYRNSTNQYYKPYALYRVLELFSELQRKQDTCKVADVLHARYSDRFFDFESENIKKITAENGCNTNIKPKQAPVQEELQESNPFGKDTKIIPEAPTSLDEVFTEQDKQVLQEKLGDAAKPELKEVQTPDIEGDDINQSIKSNNLYNMKSPEQTTDSATENKSFESKSIEGGSYSYE